MSNIKMYILVNTTLNMGKGKIAGQVGHVVSKIIRYMEKNTNDTYTQWLNNGEAKIVLKATEAEILELVKKSSSNKKIKSFTIHDAGHTQIESGSLTVLGFWPLNEKDVPSEITSKKLL